MEGNTYYTFSVRFTRCEKHLFTRSFQVGLVILAFTGAILWTRLVQHVTAPWKFNKIDQVTGEMYSFCAYTLFTVNKTKNLLK